MPELSIPSCLDRSAAEVQVLCDLHVIASHLEAAIQVFAEYSHRDVLSLAAPRLEPTSDWISASRSTQHALLSVQAMIDRL